jgi:hypothetical protein
MRVLEEIAKLGGVTMSWLLEAQDRPPRVGSPEDRSPPILLASCNTRRRLWPICQRPTKGATRNAYTNCSRGQDASWRNTRGYLRPTSGLQKESRGDLLPRTLDPLIKSANQRVQPAHTDDLDTQQLELWPDS